MDRQRMMMGGEVSQLPNGLKKCDHILVKRGGSLSLVITSASNLNRNFELNISLSLNTMNVSRNRSIAFLSWYSSGGWIEIGLDSSKSDYRKVGWYKYGYYPTDRLLEKNERVDCNVKYNFTQKTAYGIINGMSIPNRSSSVNSDRSVTMLVSQNYNDVNIYSASTICGTYKNELIPCFVSGQYGDYSEGTAGFYNKEHDTFITSSYYQAVM